MSATERVTRGGARVARGRGRGGVLARHPFAARFVLASGLLFVISLMWSFTSPVPSGPDEEAQLIKSAAIVHGTFIGTPLPGRRSAGTVSVRVPATIRNASVQAACDYKSIDRPVACAPRIPSSSREVTVTTYEGRYPPLYYVLTGLPTLVSSRPWVLYAMRAVGALVCALLLGLAFASVSAFGRSSLLTVATAFVVTPTVLYCTSVVNPSGMEIAGGIAMWAAAVVLFFRRAHDPPMAAVVSAGVGAVGLCASRPLSTLFYALIIAGLVALRPAATRSLLRLRRIQVAFVVTLAVAFVSGLYVLFAKSYEIEAFPIRKGTTGFYLLAVAGHATKVLRGVVGAFGSGGGPRNFTIPPNLLDLWYVAVFGLLFLAFVVARRRDAAVFAGLVVVFGFVLPFAIIYSHVRTDGVIWQGRYSLPLIAGLPMLAATLIEERHPAVVRAVLGRLLVVALPVLAVGSVGGFYWVLRRYTVGLAYDKANAFRIAPGGWAPKLPAVALFVIVVAATVAFEAWLAAEALAVRRRARVETRPSGAGGPLHAAGRHHPGGRSAPRGDATPGQSADLANDR